MHSCIRIIITGLILLILIATASAFEILPAGELYVNDEITIRGLTNFNEDNNILVEVFPASFWPTSKYNSTIMGGTSGVVPVQKTINSTMNTWSFTFSTVGWDPDLYMVRTEVLGKKSVQTGTYELLQEHEIQGEFIPEQLSRNETGPDKEKLSNGTQSAKLIPKTPLKDTSHQATAKTPLPIWLPMVGVILGSLYLASRQEKN